VDFGAKQINVCWTYLGTHPALIAFFYVFSQSRATTAIEQTADHANRTESAPKAAAGHETDNKERQ
jgi:hypothetical protein